MGNKKKKKRKLEETTDENGNVEVNSINDSENEGNSTKFPWKRTIRLCLKAADENELSIKKLKKKVLEEYYNFQQTNGRKMLSENEMNVLLLKKINNNPKLIVKKERVRLK